MAQSSLPAVDLAHERAERAARVAAMFDRWAAQDLSGEPEWNVEDFERLDLTRSFAGDDQAASAKP